MSNAGDAQRIWDRLISAGLTQAGAAGLMGNLYAESGLRPDNLQNTCEAKLGFTDEGYTVAVDNGVYVNFAHDGAGYGLAQWTHWTRKAGLLGYAEAKGQSIGNLDMQLGYLLLELSQLFQTVWDKLRTTDSVREASDAVLLDFERPASVNDPGKLEETKDRRTGYAREFYDKFVGGQTMSYLMTSDELCTMALDIADNFETAYMLGPWGWPANDAMITRATTQGSNAQTNRQWLAKANAIKGRGFIFDCVGLIKGILWGWSGDLSRTYGGAGYACNGVPDYDAKKMIDCCREVSTSFVGIVPGEAVWMDGHIGVYVGGGVVVESTPKWKGGVQRSACMNVSCDSIRCAAGARTWTKHGKLPWVDYTAAEKNNEEDDNMPIYKTLKDVPEHFRPTIQKLMEDGSLVGEEDPDPTRLDDNIINVSYDYCRIMTTLDRRGELD